MTDKDKLLKIAKILSSFCVFNSIVEDIAKESKCEPFIGYVDCVYNTTRDIVDIITEGITKND